MQTVPAQLHTCKHGVARHLSDMKYTIMWLRVRSKKAPDRKGRTATERESRRSSVKLGACDYRDVFPQIQTTLLTMDLAMAKS